MIAVIDIDQADAIGLLALLNEAGHGDARIVATATTTYGAVTQMLPQCSLAELRLLTIRDLSAIKRKMANFKALPCGPPAGAASTNAIQKV